MASSKRTAKTALTIGELLRTRTSKFTQSTAFVMLGVFALAQCYIISVAFSNSRNATEGWLNSNKQRIEQAMFLENALAIKGLLEESSGLRFDREKILGVEVRNTSGARAAAAGDLSSTPTNFAAELLTGRLVTRETLEFADRAQGTLLVYTAIDRSQILSSALVALLVILAASSMIELLARFLIRDIRRGVLDPLSRLTSTLAVNRTSTKDLSTLDPNESSAAEILDLITSYNKMMGQLRILSEREHAQAELENKIEIATQVSHDIRSPLSALKMVLAVANSLPDDQRSLIQASIDRINSIADSLLDKSRLASVELSAGSFDLNKALEDIVCEKTIETGYQNISVKCDTPNIEVRGNKDQFKTVVSNLLNNAIESLSTSQGAVSVQVNTRETSALIEIRDTGRGIPPDVLALLGQVPVTHGKHRGNGIGVFGATRTINSFGGKISFKSKMNKGTQVLLELRLKLDELLLREVDLHSRTHVVVVDDDKSVASMWRMTLPPSISLTSLDTPEELTARLPSFEPSALFLIDQRFENSAMTGVELINSLQLQERAILVTSDAYDQLLRDKVRSSRIRMMSKDDISSSVQA